MTDRDTKFLGFARLILQEMTEHRFLSGEDASFYYDGKLETLIAQRAYDLVAHTLHELGIDKDLPFNDATTPQDIPDLTQWPD